MLLRSKKVTIGSPQVLKVVYLRSGIQVVFWESTQ